jgi:23S rRNA G2069 N7-methylase RlmK/C1962 C5-methylase RlmI
MPLVYNDPQHWLERAREARQLAEEMRDIRGRASMLAIADEYEKIAERAMARLKHGAFITMSGNEREDAKEMLHRMIVTALDNCSEEAKIDASYPIIAQAIIDQVTRPHVTWVLKELGKPPRSY